MNHHLLYMKIFYLNIFKSFEYETLYCRLILQRFCVRNVSPVCGAIHLWLHCIASGFPKEAVTSLQDFAALARVSHFHQYSVYHV